VLTQNYLSEGASESRLQPILAYTFDERWPVGIGESEFRYDWDDATWRQIPLGIQVDHIADIGGQRFNSSSILNTISSEIRVTRAGRYFLALSSWFRTHSPHA
jgi:hypothetical protein